jgi:hypothetical protein
MNRPFNDDDLKRVQIAQNYLSQVADVALFINRDPVVHHRETMWAVLKATEVLNGLVNDVVRRNL